MLQGMQFEATAWNLMFLLAHWGRGTDWFNNENDYHKSAPVRFAFLVTFAPEASLCQDD